MINQNLTDKFFEEQISEFERKLSNKFNNITILALSENATVDSFGFNLIKNGNRQRVISGGDVEYYYDFGKPLNIEQENYDHFKSVLDEEEKEEIREDEGEDGLENYMKFQSLWGVPNSLLVKEIGKSPDEIYDENPEFLIYKSS